MSAYEALINHSFEVSRDLKMVSFCDSFITVNNSQTRRAIQKNHLLPWAKSLCFCGIWVEAFFEYGCYRNEKVIDFSSCCLV